MDCIVHGVANSHNRVTFTSLCQRLFLSQFLKLGIFQYHIKHSVLIYILLAHLIYSCLILILSWIPAILYLELRLSHEHHTYTHHQISPLEHLINNSNSIYPKPTPLVSLQCFHHSEWDLSLTSYPNQNSERQDWHLPFLCLAPDCQFLLMLVTKYICVIKQRVFSALIRQAAVISAVLYCYNLDGFPVLSLIAFFPMLNDHTTN